MMDKAIIDAIDSHATGLQPLQLKKMGASADKDTIAARRVAREFEALMVNEMLKSMRASLGKDALTEGGRGEEIYRSMLDQEYAQAIASQGTLGLSRLIEEQLIKKEEPTTSGTGAKGLK